MTNQYMQPWFDTLSQGVQVAQSLRQAALQQQQLKQAQDEFQQQQDLKQQEFGAQQQQGLAAQLEGGATPVTNGDVTVPSPVPQYTPGADGSLHPSLNFNSGTTATVPADASKPTVSIGGSTLQVPTLADQFQRKLSEQGQLQQQTNQIGLQHALDLFHATSVPLPDQISGPLGLPSGSPVAREDIPKYGATAAELTKATNPLNQPVDQKRLQTAAAAIAAENGIKVNTAKDVIPQLPMNLREAAYTRSAQLGETPDIKAERASTLATQGLTRQLTQQNIATGAVKQQNLVDAGAQLNTAGKKALELTEPLLNNIDELRRELEKPNPKDAKGGAYKDDNSPLTLAGPMMMYRAGIKSPAGELGSKISEVSLAALQGLQPYLGKSRNYKYVQDVQQHAPSLSGLAPDSPAMIYQKFGTMERSFLRMKAGAQKYETVKTGINPANPTLQDGDAQRYYNLAGSDPKLARQMATEDGWTIGQSQ